MTATSDTRLAAEEAAHLARKAGRLGPTERLVAIVGGGILAYAGLRRGGLSGLIGFGLGSALAWAGANGRSAVSAALTENARAAEIAKRRGWSAAAAVSARVKIDRPAAELYRFWRDFSNLARVMRHVERVDVLDNERSIWRVRAPAGQTVEWEARITDDQPDRRIAWESMPGADVRNYGWVEFEPTATGGTEVRAVIVYEPPGGRLGRLVAELFGEEPGVQAKRDLNRFREIMEAAAIARPDGG